MVSMIGTARTARTTRTTRTASGSTVDGVCTVSRIGPEQHTPDPAPGSGRRTGAVGRCDGLVDEVRGGDHGAWDRLVAELSPMMRSIARGYRLDEADCSDVVQTVWLRLTEHLDVVRDGTRVAGWLATTARRESLRVSRRRELPTEPWVLEVEDPAPSPEQQVLDRDEVARAHDALRRLPLRDQRLLTVLTRDPAPAYTEIAAELGMPVGSIGPTRARALTRLRRELEHPYLRAVDPTDHAARHRDVPVHGPRSAA
jgi:RNA polymerase sigma factor (sigma-70 family)